MIEACIWRDNWRWFVAQVAFYPDDLLIFVRNPASSIPSVPPKIWLKFRKLYSLQSLLIMAPIFSHHLFRLSLTDLSFCASLVQYRWIFAWYRVTFEWEQSLNLCRHGFTVNKHLPKSYVTVCCVRAKGDKLLNIVSSYLLSLPQFWLQHSWSKIQPLWKYKLCVCVCLQYLRCWLVTALCSSSLLL